MSTRSTIALISATVLTFALAGCGGGQKSSLPEYDPVGSPTATPSASGSGAAEGNAFTVPPPGSPLGEEVAARPEDAETAAGATAFATWMLSLLLHTPREDSSTTLWSSASAGSCAPCGDTASAWRSQLSKGQVFAYASTPTFTRVAVKAQPQGGGWFTQLDAAVPRASLKKGARVLQSTPAADLSYTFTLTWSEGAWEVADFHVLG